MIELYTAPTPNGYKASIALAEHEYLAGDYSEDAKEFADNARTLLVNGDDEGG